MEAAGVRAYLVNGPEEVTEAQVKGVGTVGIVSGASTPETLVEAVVTMLEPSTIVSRTVINEDVAFVYQPNFGRSEPEWSTLPADEPRFSDSDGVWLC